MGLEVRAEDDFRKKQELLEAQRKSKMKKHEIRQKRRQLKYNKYILEYREAVAQYATLFDFDYSLEDSPDPRYPYIVVVHEGNSRLLECVMIQSTTRLWAKSTWSKTSLGRKFLDKHWFMLAVRDCYRCGEKDKLVTCQINFLADFHVAITKGQFYGEVCKYQVD